MRAPMHQRTDEPMGRWGDGPNGPSSKQASKQAGKQATSERQLSLSQRSSILSRRPRSAKTHSRAQITLAGRKALQNGPSCVDYLPPLATNRRPPITVRHTRHALGRRWPVLGPFRLTHWACPLGRVSGGSCAALCGCARNGENCTNHAPRPVCPTPQVAATALRPQQVCARPALGARAGRGRRPLSEREGGQLIGRCGAHVAAALRVNSRTRNPLGSGHCAREGACCRGGHKELPRARWARDTQRGSISPRLLRFGVRLQLAIKSARLECGERRPESSFGRPTQTHSWLCAVKELCWHRQLVDSLWQ